MMPKLVGSYEPVALSVDVLHERRVERFYFGSTGDSDQDRLSRLDRLYLQCTIGEDVTSNVWCKRMCSLEASRAAVVFADELPVGEYLGSYNRDHYRTSGGRGRPNQDSSRSRRVRGCKSGCRVLRQQA
jgi:hypothetical protein